MKYTDKTPPIVCMQTQSNCYKKTKPMKVVGVLWHSTGANNPFIKRYVQPSDDDPNYADLLDVIGINASHNDWNHISRDAGLNCWIGKLANGRVSTVQTMPWDYRPWGCGSGDYGSCNTGWIQFEICQGNLDDAYYFDQVYKEACEITAYLCKMFCIDPHGSVRVSGHTIPTILCHHDSYELGFGSNHSDVMHWFPKHGKSMETARDDVANILSGGDYMTRDDILSVLSELGDKFIATFDDLPDSLKPEMRVILDEEYINGGTDKSVNPNDINMMLSDVKVLIAAKRMLDK